MSAQPTPERLLSLVSAMADRPIVVLADLVADRFVTGTPKRISREAPVLILSYQGERLAPGGGANAIANIAALGGRPLPLGIVGEDASGRELIADLAARGIETSGILVRDGYRTPTKVRILGGGRHAIKQQIVRYDIEDSLVLRDDEKRRFIERLATWPQEARIALLSDYGYGTVEPSFASELAAQMGEGRTVLLDSRYRVGSFTGIDAATPNEEEAENLSGSPLGEGEDWNQVGESLRQRLGARFLLVTRGSRGMSLFEDSGSCHLPVHGTDQVADVTGAGDTVIGTFGLSLAAGASPLEAALLANYAGGVVVMKMGTATLSTEELRAAIVNDPKPREEMVRSPRG